ncbi:MAG: hypothetical protein CBB71_12245 [Rhodopirellula sp. TMED11]|nr:MAG: hypothetical protein CBB71_12245 [Rhodopirellula sp. TMED11]
MSNPPPQRLSARSAPAQRPLSNGSATAVRWISGTLGTQRGAASSAAASVETIGPDARADRQKHPPQSGFGLDLCIPANPFTLTLPAIGLSGRLECLQAAASDSPPGLFPQSPVRPKT